MPPNPPPAPPGRGASSNTPNRFEAHRIELEPDALVDDDGVPLPRRTQFFRDDTRSILAWNDSPDIPFRVGCSPYRGCEHGCAYCFARPSHEYLGFSAGLEFESRIIVKERAAELLREELAKDRERFARLRRRGEQRQGFARILETRRVVKDEEIEQPEALALACLARRGAHAHLIILGERRDDGGLPVVDRPDDRESRRPVAHAALHFSRPRCSRWIALKFRQC